ncbi:hypothetical protein HELRODRAFT_164378 [Helobdella robusta]|uniref:Uncharacterized protein n=1 Tax=Helobdella robusta TaxID=6412 RepID=T1EVC6_HELRO|nr:hypothetical protein HELRODRAFT_164378 [Helobdella robusta]ESN94522.1 hypothetical protein HELRODRAFT_164378 [Helobdella robusta]
MKKQKRFEAPSAIKHFAFLSSKSRFYESNSANALKESSNAIGPNTYNADKLDFIDKLNKRPRSHKGYIIGARTASRFPRISKDNSIGPGAYSFPEISMKTNFKPFNSAAKRFSYALESTTPGTGTYECEYNPCKHVQYQQSFGGNPVNLPCITQHSSIKSNTDKVRL